MKKITILFLSLFILLSMKSVGQNQSTLIPLTNGGFENWSTGSGYSVSILTLYSSYPYPTGWNYPTYPVNESISLGITSVNVNTNLPLLKVANETSGVPEGSHAVKLQSFKLSDIISSTAYSLASSSLDESLTTTVFPTVLSTGVIDIDQLLPLMGDLTSNLDNLPQLVSVFAGVDLNNLINGGISLNGEIIGRMTGYYKYSSAVGGDNGGVLMLGSKYNPATHRRELVGVGYTTALTDVSSYTPFEINYSPLSEIDDTYSYVQADSLIVMLLSSANTDAQQGSALYLDNLQLWTGFPPTVVADPTFGDTTATACGNFNWFGEVLTASGDYTHLFENGNANGGDSTVTLHLTINQPTEGEVTVAACGSYSWFGEDFTTSGD